MKRFNKFIKPELEIIEFNNVDIFTTSDPDMEEGNLNEDEIP